MSTAELIYYAHKAGLTLFDFENMTVGMIEDVIAVHCNYQTQVNKAMEEHANDLKGGKKHSSKTSGIRNATQADFDRFQAIYG